MGHFDRAPIGLSWLCFVLPALMLNYMGQGAMVLLDRSRPRPQLIQDPFFLMMPDTRGASPSSLPRAAGDDHCQSGRHFGRLFADSSRPSSSVSCRLPDQQNIPVRRRTGQIYIPVVN